MAYRLSGLVLAATIGILPFSVGQEKKAEDKKAEEKKADPKENANAEKLIGSWELQDADLTKIDGKATFEFTKDGKAKMSIEIGKQKPIVIDGTYKLDGSKLTLAAKKGDKDESEVVDIKTIDGSELVLLDKQKKEVKFKKPEPKMPAKDPFPKGGFPKSPFPMEPFPQ